MLDTGQNIPESRATLLLQQKQLVAGRRDVQMFPGGVRELPLPAGMARHQNVRGVFHFNPSKIDAATIDRLSVVGRENEFLNLGPFNKFDIAVRVAAGDVFQTITEYTPDGIEVRCAAASQSTLPVQCAYFEQTKDEGNVIVVGDMAPVMQARRAA
jgi:hypothetical protein